MRISCVAACLFFLVPLALLSQETVSDVSRDEALSRLRSDAQARNARTNFVVVQEVTATEHTRQVAEAARRELPSASCRGQDAACIEEILLGLLEHGGFVVLEYDPESHKVLSLHTITRGHGQLLVDSRELGGDVELEDARRFRETAKDFISELFSSPQSKIDTIYDKFFSGRIPPEPDEFAYFRVPKEVERLGSEAQVRQYAALAWGFVLTPFRWSLTKPTYAANPTAYEKSVSEVELLSRGFLAQKGLTPNQIEALFNFEAVASQWDLSQRIALLTELSAYLDSQITKNLDPNVFAINRSLTATVFEIDAHAGEGQGETKYCAAFLPVFGACWRRTESGFVLLGMTDGI